MFTQSNSSILHNTQIIQGGMGVGVSGWRLAKASAMAGAIGTVSGTAVANLMAYELQSGDKGGNLRRALASFPYPKIAEEVLGEYYVKKEDVGLKEKKDIPMWSFKPSRKLVALTICANYSFVWLAKEGHNNPIFVNFLEKIQMPHVCSVLGAMLAKVDGIAMGAGLPRYITNLIDQIMEGGNMLSYPIFVKNHPNKNALVPLELNAVEFLGGPLPEMIRPLFLPIVTAPSLAIKLLEWCPGKINGFIVEASTAGGHNAPPRGQLILNEKGEPVYGERDKIKTEEFAKLEVPFWIAGSFASPSGLAHALEVGASGIQVGTAFAFCDESGIIPSIKNKVRLLVYRRGMKVFTDPKASPTGYPFKILNLRGTLSEEELYNSRIRNCSLGYLREPVWNGEKIIFRCAAEPIEAYLKKGGEESATVGCKCICAGLCSTVGIRDGELPIVTAGDDLDCIRHCMQKGHTDWCEDSTYSAKDVVSFIKSV